VLVGADGLHSRVRSLIDPKAPRARYVGLLNAGGYAQGLNVPGKPGTMQMFFGKRCFFCYVPRPGGEVWWFANPARPREPSREDLAAMTQQQWRAELRQLFAADGTPAVDIIDSTPTIMAGWVTYDFSSVPHWHRDRMIIIGDAAHAASPSSGQGASMAIEDAIVLATCLRDEPTIAKAFAAFERQRRERVERVVAQGRRNGFGKTPGPLGRVLRDLALRVVFRRPAMVTRSMDWIFDHRIDWERSVIVS
jgi:2-polyprenyl-6-methoxyphenol hydroxylase-like FAD-dependent oxidoreductase